MTICKGVNGFTPKTVLEYSVQSFYGKYEDVYSTSDYKETKFKKHKHINKEKKLHKSEKKCSDIIPKHLTK